MKTRNGPVLSRREFAQRAALLSATSIVPPRAILDLPTRVLPDAQAEAAGVKLSPEGQAEADARYQQVLSLYGDRLNEEEKTRVKKMCAELQPALDRIRSHKLENGNAPALYLKPLYERDKKPQSASLTSPSSSTDRS
jgi:hypothetical protein